MERIETIGVLGAGAWGTALALVAARAGRSVTLWARRAEAAEALARSRRNDLYLPGVDLPPAISVTNDLEKAAGAEALLLVVPAQHLRTLAEDLRRRRAAPRPLVICAKGIELRTEKLLTEMLEEVLPGWPLAVLSGPTFAQEVARGLPTAVTLASRDSDLAKILARSIGGRSFRPYLSDDPLGAEIGGALKNVIAIACGIVAGRGLGENARAALITRGLAEITRLGRTKGARSETLMGLSGLGDLTLTCTGMASRNYSLGVALGEGGRLTEILASRRTVSEGVPTAAAATALARKLGIELPVSAAVDAIANRGEEIGTTITGLLDRPLKSETV